jgi:hypothetical protein
MKVILMFLGLLCMALPCCKKDSAPNHESKPVLTPVGVNDGTAVTKTIGAGGGTVISGDGQMEVIIPAGALSANTDIVIQPITNNAPNGRRKAHRCLPDGLQFSKNITLKFHYTEAEAAATKPEYMMVAFHNADGHWQVVEDVDNDVANNVVSAYVNHFTDFTGFDVMRIQPAVLYLKPGQTGEYALSFTGMALVHRILLLGELLEKPETWKYSLPGRMKFFCYWQKVYYIKKFQKVVHCHPYRAPAHT